MKRILILTAALLMLVALASCAKKSDEGGTPSSAGETPSATPGTSGDLATATPSTSVDTAAVQPKAAAPATTRPKAVAPATTKPKAVAPVATRPEVAAPAATPAATPAAPAPAATKPEAAAPPVASPASAPAGLDDGPRAASEPVDAALAAKGAGIFKSKACVTCHAFGRKVIGPDLAGVSRRRTSLWMASQILHPEKMIVQDPTAKALFAQYKIPMTNQNLTPDQAKAVVEYLKQTDRGGK